MARNAAHSGTGNNLGTTHSLTEICYLYSIKIEGEGVFRKWSCKDSELTLKKAFCSQINEILSLGSVGNSAVKIERGRGARSYLYTVKIANLRQTLMSSLTKIPIVVLTQPGAQGYSFSDPLYCDVPGSPCLS